MAKPKEKAAPKLPLQQLAILGVVRFSEPVALTSVFPYLPEMIQSFGVPRNDVAKWAGVTSAVFSVGQSLTAVPWGWASDRVGRKPTIILGLLSTMICFLFWGFSTSLAMAITVRGIHGCGNGNIGIIRTMVAEMVPEKVLQPRAFAIMPMIWCVGSVFGPSFGGFFARPAEQYPNLFGKNKFLQKYPFALPNLIACAIFLTSVITATFFLKETLESRKHKTDWGIEVGNRIKQLFGVKPTRKNLGALARARAQAEHRARRRSFVGDESAAPLLATTPSEADLPLDNAWPPADSADPVTKDDAAAAVAAVADNTPPPTHRPPQPAPAGHASIFNRQTSMVLFCYSILALHSVSYDQILPVFLNFPQEHHDSSNTHLPFKFSGGFGLASGRIGTLFTLNAIGSAIGQFIVFPPLCARYGALNCFRVACVFYPFLYFLTPYVVLIEEAKLRYAVFILSFLVKGALGVITFPCVTIVLTNSAPSLKVLGTLNGFATTFSSVGKAIGPASTGAFFTLGVQHGYIISGWWLLAVISTVGAVAPFFLGEGPGIEHPRSGDEEELADAEEDDDADAYVGGDGYDDDDYEESLLGEFGDDDQNAANGNAYSQGGYDGSGSNATPSSRHQSVSRSHSRVGSRGGSRTHSRAQSRTHSRHNSRQWSVGGLPAPTTSLFADDASAAAAAATPGTGCEPTTPADERQLPKLPKLRMPLAAKLSSSSLSQQDLPEPEDPEPYDEDGTVRDLGIDYDLPPSPVRARRFRSGSSVSRKAKDDPQGLPMSPVVTRGGREE